MSHLIWIYAVCKSLFLSLVAVKELTHLCRVDSATSTLWTGPVPTEGVSVYFLLLLCFIKISVSNANIVDPDQMPHSAASDLGLHCLPMSLLWDIRHK